MPFCEGITQDEAVCIEAISRGLKTVEEIAPVWWKIQLKKAERFWAGVRRSLREVIPDNRCFQLTFTTDDEFADRWSFRFVCGRFEVQAEADLRAFELRNPAALAKIIWERWTDLLRQDERKQRVDKELEVYLERCRRAGVEPLQQKEEDDV